MSRLNAKIINNWVHHNFIEKVRGWFFHHFPLAQFFSQNLCRSWLEMTDKILSEISLTPQWKGWANLAAQYQWGTVGLMWFRNRNVSRISTLQLLWQLSSSLRWNKLFLASVWPQSYIDQETYRVGSIDGREKCLNYPAYSDSPSQYPRPPPHRPGCLLSLDRVRWLPQAAYAGRLLSSLKIPFCWRTYWCVMCLALHGYKRNGTQNLIIGNRGYGCCCLKKQLPV